MIFGVVGYIGQIFRHSFSSDRHAVAVQESLVEQSLHQRQDAANIDQLAHGVDTCRTHISKHGHALTDTTEVVEAQRDIGCMGNGQ